MKYIKYLALCIFIFIITIIAIIMYFLRDMCGNEIYKEYSSPNKLLKAIVFRRDCGATTGYTTELSIINFNESLDNTNGNIYMIKGIPKDVAPYVYWEDNNKLIINAPLSGLEYKAESSFGWFSDIKIEYK